MGDSQGGESRFFPLSASAGFAEHRVKTGKKFSGLKIPGISDNHWKIWFLIGKKSTIIFMNVFKSIIRFVTWILFFCSMSLAFALAQAAANPNTSNKNSIPFKLPQPFKATPQNTNPPPPTSQQIDEIIRTLQDPQAREKLIQQLTILSQAQQQMLVTTVPTIKNQASITVANLSESISEFHTDVTELVTTLLESKQYLNNFAKQLTDIQKRNQYSKLLLKCLAVILLSYGGYWLSANWMPKIYRRFARGRKKRYAIKLINLCILTFLSLIPIVIFAFIANFILILLQLGNRAQWVLLAWTTAFIIVKVLNVIYNFLFALIVQFPTFLNLSESAERFLMNWLRLLTTILVYGYFTLQVALFLGMSLDIYDVLTKLLGFIVVVLLIVFVLRNPLRMIRLIITHRTKGGVPIAEERITQIDFIFRVTAIIYLFLLYVVWIVRADHFFWFVLKGTVFSLLLIFVAIKSAQLLHRYFTRPFTVSSPLRKRLPGLEKRFRRYRKILDVVLRALLYIALIVFIIRIWGIQMTWVPSALRVMLVIKFISILCIGLAIMLMWEISNSLIEVSLTKNGEEITLETGRTHTLLTVARRTVLITLTLIAILMVLSEVGVNIGPLLAGAGVLGLAISLGGQTMIRDIITGFLMLLEHQVAIGDYVTIGDKSGTVEAISIRTMSLRDTNGVVHIIPYSSIVTVSNYTKEFSYALFEVSVSYRENVDDVIAVIRKISAELQKDATFKPLILEPLDMMGLDKFLDSGVIIRFRLKTKPGFQWQVGREFNKRMKQRFDELDIQLPFPHRVIYFGEAKDHSAPPAHVKVQKSGISID